MDEFDKELSTYCIFHGQYSEKYQMCPECRALALDSDRERAKDGKRGISVCWKGKSKGIYINRLPK